eukprot:11894635-Alexandrium_andersonii.AAC.1
MSASLVGSEMCIRDRLAPHLRPLDLWQLERLGLGIRRVCRAGLLFCQPRMTGTACWTKSWRPGVSLPRRSLCPRCGTRQHAASGCCCRSTRIVSLHST